MEKKYEYLDHTADIIIKAYGKDFSEALANSILALSNICIDLDFEINKKLNIFEERKIIVKSSSKEALFYDLLNEVIFLIDTEFISPIYVEDYNFEQNGDYLFSATLKCVDVKKAKILGSVKSATYNNMDIFVKNEKVIIQTTVDI
jgi:SHS2 domain-containing protein